MDLHHLLESGEGRMKECQECGRWGYVEGHHKVHKGRDKKGWDFPANMIDLCVDNHYGSKGPHRCYNKRLQYMREVKDYLLETLTEDYYLPEQLAAAIQLPMEQAYQVVKLLKVYDGGYRKEDIIFRLLGNRHEWVEKNAV
jgi:hypothetical protein